MAKKKNAKINPIIYLLICSVLLFAIYNSISVFVLGFCGDTTVGVLTSYDSRLDDQTAEANRSRTVSKGYRFTVSGKEYKGYVIYKSDEAWPRLRDDEVRTESIRYLSVLPYVNKPEHLVDWRQLGEAGLLFHIFTISGCVFLFLLVSGRLGKRRKRTKKTTNATKESNARRKETVFCENCRAKLPEGAAFCGACGTKVQKSTAAGMCGSCGADLPAQVAFCPNCGAPVGEAAKGATNVPAQTAATSSQSDIILQNQAALVGWSEKSHDPEILEAARKNKKSAAGCMWIFTLLFPIGFLLAGLFIDEMPLGEGLIIGAVLGVLMLIINLMRIKDLKNPVWEGVVTKKFKKERRRHRDDNVDTYTEYTTVIRTDAGKKKQIVEKDSQRQMYDYLAVGDRVRYHPAFGTYEKHDKSKDRIIYCNVCSMMNPIENDRCKRCNNLLFKREGGYQYG
ncbi:MAG: double zinc ribbon domain-containing protein [bacterium]|jgi:hypothetical protein